MQDQKSTSSSLFSSIFRIFSPAKHRRASLDQDDASTPSRKSPLIAQQRKKQDHSTLKMQPSSSCPPIISPRSSAVKTWTALRKKKHSHEKTPSKGSNQPHRFSNMQSYFSTMYSTRSLGELSSPASPELTAREFTQAISTSGALETSICFNDGWNDSNKENIPSILDGSLFIPPSESVQKTPADDQKKRRSKYTFSSLISPLRSKKHDLVISESAIDLSPSVESGEQITQTGRFTIIRQPSKIRKEKRKFMLENVNGPVDSESFVFEDEISIVETDKSEVDSTVCPSADLSQSIYSMVDRTYSLQSSKETSVMRRSNSFLHRQVYQYNSMSNSLPSLKQSQIMDEDSWNADRSSLLNSGKTQISRNMSFTSMASVFQVDPTSAQQSTTINSPLINEVNGADESSELIEESVETVTSKSGRRFLLHRNVDSTARSIRNLSQNVDPPQSQSPPADIDHQLTVTSQEEISTVVGRFTVIQQS